MNRRDAIKAAVGAGVAAVLPVQYPARVASEATFVAVVNPTYRVGALVTHMTVDTKAFAEGLRKATVTINEARQHFA